MADERELAEGLFPWEVTLNDGSVMHLRAHSYGHDGEEFAFYAYLAGKPLVVMELLRIPKAIVLMISGGPE